MRTAIVVTPLALVSTALLLASTLACSQRGNELTNKKVEPPASVSATSADSESLTREIQGAINRDIKLTQALLTAADATNNVRDFYSFSQFCAANIEERKEIIYGLGALKNTEDSTDLETVLSFLKEENAWASASSGYAKTYAYMYQEQYNLPQYMTDESPALRNWNAAKAELAHWRAYQNTARQELERDEQSLKKFGWSSLWLSSEQSKTRGLPRK